ncbi:MAG TPA: hypothetical protein VGK67_25790 [Myxococcales bacterium]|jgi:hypothetical protein
MKKQLALSLAALLSGAACSPIDPGTGVDGGRPCQRGAQQSCTCERGGGIQTCGDDGRWGACACPGECVPGRSEACSCSDGRPGARLCKDDGVFRACVCTPALPDAGGMPGSDASTLGPDAGTFLTGTVSTGVDDILVDFFPVPNGLVVVRKAGIDLLDGTNTLVASVPASSDLTAAAFDGTLLGVADQAMLSVYDVSLSVQVTAALAEPCGSAVVVSGSRFVCGPATDVNRAFSTYDMTTGAMLAVSAKRTYEGIPMRRVPGTDDFVTVTTDSTPSDFFLHRVGADHLAVSYGESPYHGDFAATMAFAFDGTPPTHLIQMAGIFLKIYGGDGCAPSQSVNSTGCFIRDGELGTLAGDDKFVAMADDGGGTLYALATSRDDPNYCDRGCKAQRIDVGRRLVVGETTVTFVNAARIVGAKWDPYGGRLLVGFLRHGPSGSYKGYELQAVAP